MYAAAALARHTNLLTGMDLAIFGPAIDHLSRGEAPVSEIKGFLIWGDHFHPLIAVLALPWKIWPDPRCLLIIQAICGGASVAVTARAGVRIARHPAGALTGLALAVSPGMQSGLLFDFHEVGLGLPLLALALDAYLSGRWWRCAAWAGTLLLVKEDMPFLALSIAIALAARRRWAPAICLAAAALTWLVVVVGAVLPALHPGHVYGYRHTTQSPLGSLWTSLVSDGRGATTTLILLCGTGFLGLRSPLIAAFALPALTRYAADNSHYWGLEFHYTMLAEVALAFAALDGWRRIRGSQWSPTCTRALVLVGVCATTVVMTGPLAGAFTGPRNPTARLEAVRAAIERAPAGAAVLTESRLAPHTVPRLRARLLPPPARIAEVPTTTWLLLDLRSETVNPQWMRAQLATAPATGRVAWTRAGIALIAPAR
ncbi:MAG: DUF2079 domain-containing protein [Tetrasphaera sp.]